MFILGIDVGKLELYCRLFQTTEKGSSKLGSVQMFPNTEEGRYRLKQWLTGHQALGDTTHGVMEATGVYSQWIAHALYTVGCQVSVVNGAQIKYFARTTLRRGKTDKMDAELIAQYGLTMKPPLWRPTRDELEHLRALMSERDAIQTLITMEKGRHHAMDHQQNPCLTVVERCEARQKLLEDQLDQVDDEIKKTIQEDSLLKTQVELLCSIPGVGPLTASILLTETHHLENLETAKQWAAFAGLTPMPKESGQFKGRTKISKVGNKKIRRILYLSALTVSRMDNKQTEFYQRLVEAGKPKKVALIALARKILRICFAVLRSGEPYAAGHRSQPAVRA